MAVKFHIKDHKGVICHCPFVIASPFVTHGSRLSDGSTGCYCGTLNPDCEWRKLNLGVLIYF